MDTKEIIKRIRYIRNNANLSARELSLRIGKNEHYINRLEVNQNFNPTINTLSDIIEVCNSSFDEFFYYDISKYKKDKEIFDLLQNATQDKKELVIQILKM